MVSGCLPSNALSQCIPSYWGFCDPGPKWPLTKSGWTCYGASTADNELHPLCGSIVGGRTVEMTLPHVVASVPSLQVSSPTTLIPHPQDPLVYFMIHQLKGSHVTQQSPIKSWLQDWGQNITWWVLFSGWFKTLDITSRYTYTQQRKLPQKKKKNEL